jgi:hypothetical protein
MRAHRLTVSLAFECQRLGLPNAEMPVLGLTTVSLEAVPKYDLVLNRLWNVSYSWVVGEGQVL